MQDLILIAVLAVIIGGPAIYIYKAKKRGVKCIGCPDSKTCASADKPGGCGGNCSSCSGCSCHH